MIELCDQCSCHVCWLIIACFTFGKFCFCILVVFYILPKKLFFSYIYIKVTVYFENQYSCFSCAVNTKELDLCL
jgi:hypothetical protein